MSIKLSTNILLSIIIPFSNSEKTISRCIESVLKQQLTDYELILVANNSTDESVDICYEYKQQDARISLIIESRFGAAFARNRGIKAAKGKYIAFVDADDYVSSTIYSKTIGLLEKYEADMACCSFNYVDNAGKPMGWYEPNLNKYLLKHNLFTNNECAKIFLTTYDIEGFCWNKVFRTSIIRDNNLVFDETKVSFEDMLFVFNAILCSEKIVLLPEKLYYYCQREGSLTKDYEDKRRTEFNSTIAQIIDKASFLGLNDIADSYGIARRVLYNFDYTRNTKVKGKLLPANIGYMDAVKCVVKYQRQLSLKIVLLILYDLLIVEKVNDNK